MSLAVGLVTGICAGLGSAAFLHGLTWATKTRIGHEWLLWLLPVAGLGIGFLRRLAGRATGGTNLLLNEFHDNDASTPAGAARSNGVPVRLAPFVYVGSVVTHLFGGSGGREGAAVQIAAGMTSTLRPRLVALGRRWNVAERDVRQMLIVAALAGGFGSVFGVPWAGMVFGVEVARHWEPARAHFSLRRTEVVALLPVAAVASFVGHALTSRLGIHHLALPRPGTFSPVAVVVVAVASGLLARAYLLAHHLVFAMFTRSRLPELLWPVVGGVVIIGATLAVGTRAYLGLSLPLIDAALAGAGVASAAFAFKLGFTAITLGSGFPGGEVTPLLCMGACLGATLAGPLNGSVSALAAVGMVATWSAASNTPISAAVMGAELFGPATLLVFAPLNVLATLMSGTASVYRAQR